MVRAAIIRSKQRVVTNISPHAGNDQYLIPRGPSGSGPARIRQGTLQVGTFSNKRGFSRFGGYGTCSIADANVIEGDVGNGLFLCTFSPPNIQSGAIYLFDSILGQAGGGLRCAFNGTSYEGLSQSRANAWAANVGMVIDVWFTATATLLEGE